MIRKKMLEELEGRIGKSQCQKTTKCYCPVGKKHWENALLDLIVIKRKKINYISKNQWYFIMKGNQSKSSTDPYLISLVLLQSFSTLISMRSGSHQS